MADETRNRLRDIFYEKLGRENMNLLWQLKETLNLLPVKRMLDVGAGMRVSKNICLPDGVESALVIDPDGDTLRGLSAYYCDARLELVQVQIEAADLEGATFDLALFVMSLLWIGDPAATLQKVASRSPAYIVIATPEFSAEQRSKIPSSFPEHATELDELLECHYARKLDIDATMESLGYHPLAVFSSASWSPTPEHRLRTVLYTQEKPDRTPYDKAKFIFQVNSVCNCNCPVCYVGITGKHMNAAVFNELIEDVSENETICLRGGEPTLTKGLIADFITPALKKGIHVILESNGAFIETPRYREYLEVLTQENIEIRLSLDRQHVDSFPVRVRPIKIKWMSRFIDDATRLNIKFGLFSLGMSREQLKEFLEEYSASSWLGYIRLLTKYSDITELPIKCRFVDVEGEVHDHITGVGWIGSPDEGNFKDLISSLDG